MAPRYVPDNAQMDPRGLSGGVAAMMVALINKCDGIDLRKEEDLQALGHAVETLMPKYVSALVKAQYELGRDQYAD